MRSPSAPELRDREARPGRFEHRPAEPSGNRSRCQARRPTYEARFFQTHLYSWYWPTSTSSSAAMASSTRTAAEQYSEIKYEASALLLIPMKRTDSPGVCSPGSPG